MFLPSYFSIFLCAMTCLSLTLCKTFFKNVQKKNVSIPMMDEKKLHIREFQMYFLLSRSIFQISLKYIKLVIPKILSILVLCSLILTSKLRETPPPTKLPLPPTIYPPHQNKKFLTPPPPAKTMILLIFNFQFLLLTIDIYKKHNTEF